MHGSACRRNSGHTALRGAFGVSRGELWHQSTDLTMLAYLGSRSKLERSFMLSPGIPPPPAQGSAMPKSISVCGLSPANPAGVDPKPVVQLRERERLLLTESAYRSLRQESAITSVVHPQQWHLAWAFSAFLITRRLQIATTPHKQPAFDPGSRADCMLRIPERMWSATAPGIGRLGPTSRGQTFLRPVRFSACSSPFVARMESV